MKASGKRGHATLKSWFRVVYCVLENWIAGSRVGGETVLGPANFGGINFSIQHIQCTH